MIGQQYLKNVVSLRYNAELCNGCRMCVEVCPHAVFRMEDKRAVLAEPDRCMECGACMVNCKEQAIFVKAGVGCAAAVMNSYLSKSKQPSCGCDAGSTCCG